ncbi:MAG: Ferric reductase like transmembrane component, partial [Porphyrobacter sp. HL-46]
MATRAGGANRFSQDEKRRDSDHVSFIKHKGFRWLWIALALSAVSILGYALIDQQPRPNGGSWYGYTLGTIGFGLIIWLSLLGVRKRRINPGAWSLKAWTSAHVYLGLSLVVVGTLHTGFQIGWNVHTLAYVLMLLVIATGIYGVIVYATLPASLSANRKEMTRAQMLDA